MGRNIYNSKTVLKKGSVMKKTLIYLSTLLSVLPSEGALHMSSSQESLQTISFEKDQEAYNEIARGINKRVPTNFRDLTDIISKIDGKKGFFDARSYQLTLLAMKAIFEIQYGTLNKETKQRTGLYTFQDKIVTLQDLVIKERDLIKTNTPKNNPVFIEFSSLLQKIKDDFNQKMKAVRGRAEDNPIAKNLKHRLIALYMQNQNLPHSHLQYADTSEEKIRLDAINALDFFRFLNELRYFLEDLTDSCTEGRKLYQEYIQKNK